VVVPTSVAGGGGGHFGGGGGFHSAPAFHGRGLGGLRYSFGARPTYGRPVYVRPQSQIARSTTHAPVFTQRRSSVSDISNRTARTGPTSHSVAPKSAMRPSDNARNHIFAREDGIGIAIGTAAALTSGTAIGGLGRRLLDRSRRRLLSRDYYPYYATTTIHTITTLVTMRTLSLLQ